MFQLKTFKILGTCLFLLFLFTTCSKDKDDDVLTVGKWIATAEFGGFDFVINDAATYITEIKYRFDEWACGSVIRSGSITVSSNPGWKIDSDLTFEISQDLDPSPFDDFVMNISGTLIPSDRANGTWDADSNRCSGSWSASPE